MAYSDLLDNEGIVSQYLVVLKPRRLLDTTAWANPSGTLYTQTFSLGEIRTLEDNGTVKTKASTSALSDGDWFHDTSTNLLSFDDGADPASSDIVVTYEIYLGTFDAHFYRDPLDNTTRVVYYEPIITKSPTISQSSTDDLFGFLPTITNSISVSNTTQFLQEHVYESSFHNAVIKVYHFLDELTVANTKLVTSGFCGNVKYKEKETSIEIFDNRAIFDEDFRHVDGMQFYASGTLSNLDPDFDGRPVRKVYGVVDKFIPVNIDFSETASTTTNRDWICINPHDNLGSVTATVSSSPSSTTTRTYVDDVSGIRVGDTVHINKATDEYVEVTAVNTSGSDYFEHAALVSGAAAASDTCIRNFIGHVTIVRDGFAPIKLKYIDDYTEYTDATNKLAGFTLNDNFESSYNSAGQPFNSSSGSTSLEATDLVFCRVYGNTNQETLSASAFGGDSATTGSMTQAIVIIYSILKNNIGLTEAELDTATFTSLQSSITDEIGFAIPSNSSQNFPKYKDVLTSIFQTLLMKFLIDDSGLYSLVQTGPLGSTDKTIEDDEILLDSFEASYDYKDVISDVIVEYEPKEVGSRNQTSDSYAKVTSSSDLATRLHGVTKQKTFKSLHFTSSEAQTLADRLKYALGDRRGRIRFKTKNRFFDSEINQVIRVTRDRQPGFAYVDGTDQNRDGVIVSASKSLSEIAIEIDDQKGIEDNSGSW
jgi:hypothetical protein